MKILSSADIIDDGRAVELGWSEGTSNRFHSIWLRDNALDDDTRSPQNGQRLISVLDLPTDPRITSAQISSSGDLQLTLDSDHKPLSFPTTWLAQHVYDSNSDRSPAWTSEHIERWNSELANHVPTTDFEAASNDPSVLADWLAAIQRYGFAKMTGVPTDNGRLCDVAELFGYVRETNYGRYFEVRSEVNPVNLAYTGLGLQAHSDNPYRDPVPTLQILNCLENSADGGESIVVDAFKAVEQLAIECPEHLRLLSQHCARFEYAGSSDVCLQSKRPMIELGPDGELIGVRFNNRSVAPLVDIPYDEMSGYYAAYRRFAEIITQPQLEVSFKLQPGELFIVDNTRVLHSRKAFSGAGSRWLQGCYADKDGLLSTLRTLRAANNEEAA